MLQILRERLIDGLSIVSFKENYSKFKVEFEYEGERAIADLPKTCMPNCEKEVADNAIKTAMSTIYFNRGDYVTAREWLHK